MLLASLLILLILIGSAKATTDECKSLLLAAETHNEEKLTGQGYDGGAIARALQRNEESTAECLITEDIDVNWKNSVGKTTLMFAVEHGEHSSSFSPSPRSLSHYYSCIKTNT